jgi:hypothetical protein
MKAFKLRSGTVLVFIVLAMILTGCGGRLPPEAKDAVLRGYAQDEKPRIDSAQQVEPLPEDLELGAEEVWCVNLVFSCWSCGYGEWRTCADSRLVRQIDGEWQVSVVFTEEDKEKWEARGCELMPDRLDGS